MNHLQKKRNLALGRQKIVRPLVLNPNTGSSDLAAAAIQLDVSDRTIRRYVGAYRAAPILETLMPGHRVSPSRRARLPEKTREIVNRNIVKRYLKTKERISARELHALIEDECLEENTKLISLRHLQRMLKRISQLKKAKAKQINKDPRDLQLYPHHHEVGRVLDEVQIDHTLVDVILDLSEYGLGLKRIWVTLAIDVASRLVFGYYLGLKSPSARTSGLALAQGILPKRSWVEDIGLSVQSFEKYKITDPWPIAGVPKIVATDNGRDFDSRAFKAGCEQLGAQVRFRPRGKPHYGGHIERLIGTFMKSVHTLPGTTFSNVKERGRYKSSERCFLTLEDFEMWFVTRILEYHLTPHSGLGGVTPLQQFHKLQGTL